MYKTPFLLPTFVTLILLAVGQSALSQPGICSAINCDCDNIDAGILNRGWVPACRDRERDIRQVCEETEGSTLEQCDPVAHGPDAWPLEGNRDQPPPTMQSALTVAVAMAESSPRSRQMRLINEDIILDNLEPYGAFIEGFEVFNRASRAKGATMWASDVAVEALDEFDATCNPDRVPVKTFGRLLEAQRAVVESTPVPYESLRKSIERVERLNKLGLGIEELTTQGGFIPTQKSTFTHVAAYVDSALKWTKTAESGSAYLAGDTTRAGDFVGDAMSHVPKNVSLAADGPVGVFFRDLMAWNVNLFDASTAGLDYVSDSIDQGCSADPARFERVRGDLERLGRDGPWTEKTVGDSLKKMVTGIPGIGKIANFIWPSND